MNQTTKKYHLIPTKMATIKVQTIASVCKNKIETLMHCWECKMLQLVQKTVLQFLQK